MKVVKKHWKLIVICLIPIAIIGSLFISYKFEEYQATRKIERALDNMGYANRIVRRSAIKEESGPLSGIIWYDYTFANNETLAASYQYQKVTKNKSKKFTLNNCPIVYRVVLRKAAKSVKTWGAELYLDTNQEYAYSPERESYVQLLKKTSTRNFDVPVK